MRRHGEAVMLLLLAPQGLREHGYRPETIQVIEARTRRGDEASIRATVQTLAGQDVSVLFVIGSAFARVARDTAPRLPPLRADHVIQ